MSVREEDVIGATPTWRAEASGSSGAGQDRRLEYDAVVCGAGAGGLAMARVLGMQGRRVLLVEKEHHFRHAYKGEILQPRSVRTLTALGMLHALEEGGSLRANHLMAFLPSGKMVGDLDYSMLPAPYDHMLIHRFSDVRQAMASKLGPGVDFMPGASVIAPLYGLSGRVSGVQLATDHGTVAVSAALTVACDGRASRLRQAVGIEVQAERYAHQFVGFDIADVSLADQRISAHVTPDGVRLIFPMPNGRARLYIQAPRGTFRGGGRSVLAAWLDSVVVSLPALQAIGDSVRASLGTVQILPIWRLDAAQWVRPGLALVGDAAHCVHPMAAQGMNAAIDDAWALGVELGRMDVFRATDIDAALTRYEAFQRPRQAYLSRLSHNIATLFTGTSWFGQRFRDYELRLLRANRRLQFIMLYNMAGLGIHRFSFVDRLHQIGVPDPRAARVPVFLAEGAAICP
jgi:2-polyprenyl-6-methoxyphenol hydroxylase-like FAD-dependent oxidoreductase